VTNICLDKTSTLTQNKIKVVARTVSTNQLFNNNLRVSQTVIDLKALSLQEISTASATVTVLTSAFIRRSLISAIKEMLKQSIVANSTAFESQGEDGWQTFIKSQTETAFLTFAQDHLGSKPLSIKHSNIKTV
jgi:magnesium-transporting ATPase (P-type)